MLMGDKDPVMGKNNTIMHRKNLWRSVLAGILGLFALVALHNCVGCQTFRKIPQTGQQRREDLKPELAALIDEFRASVPKLMKNSWMFSCASR